VTVVVATHNRCAALRGTIAKLQKCEMSRGDYEIIVVDNASTDGTLRAIDRDVDVLIELRRNRGSCAKAYGASRARGRYIVFLDDDSCPRLGSLSRMIERFEQDSDLGAAGFTVHRADGSQEGAALPGVFVGCGVGFRAEALRNVGGLDVSFFMQAEEYDVCFRLAGEGWNVEVFDDLHVDHRKTTTARCPSRTTYYDVRNNLRVLARYAPKGHYGPLREDCIARYASLAALHGHENSFRRGLRQGTLCARLERFLYRKKRMSDAVFERFYRWDEIERKMGGLATRGVKRIVLADLGKNIYGYWRAARRVGIEVEAIGDDRFAVVGRAYRGIAVLPLAEALEHRVDAVVVSNSSPVHGNSTAIRVRSMTPMPVFCWLEGPCKKDDPGLNFGPPGLAADNALEKTVRICCP